MILRLLFVIWSRQRYYQLNIFKCVRIGSWVGRQTIDFFSE